MLFAARFSLSLSLSLSISPSLSFLFPFSYLISVIIHISCVLKWSSKKCLKGWVTGWQMIVQCMSDDGCGQDFMLMDNWFWLLQIKTGSFANGKRTCGGFILPGFWTEMSFERFMSVQVIFRPAPLVLNMLLDFWPISWTPFWATVQCKWVL